MKFKKISPGQKKIIFTAFILAAVFLSLWIFLYLPRQAQAIRMKAELLQAEKQIGEIEEIMAKGKISGKGIELLKERYHRLRDKFPRQEEVPVIMLGSLARRYNIKVASSTPQPRRAYLDENQQSLIIEGRSCQVVSVSLEAKTTYKDLLRYLQALRESFPAFTTVERLKITRDEAAAGKINVYLEINIYLLS